ncbi:hypothetical protein WJD08_22600, partial [Salmonella enterica subsp. enterica serovar Corvallis]
CAAPSAKGDDKFITTDYLQQCLKLSSLTFKNSKNCIYNNVFIYSIRNTTPVKTTPSTGFLCIFHASRAASDLLC